MEQDIPDYDMDSEDERWVGSQANKFDLTPLKKGTRVILDRASTPMDDIFSSLDFTVLDSAAENKNNQFISEIRRDCSLTKLHFRPKTPPPSVGGEPSVEEVAEGSIARLSPLFMHIEPDDVFTSGTNNATQLFFNSESEFYPIDDRLTSSSFVNDEDVDTFGSTRVFTHSSSSSSVTFNTHTSSFLVPSVSSMGAVEVSSKPTSPHPRVPANKRRRYQRQSVNNPPATSPVSNANAALGNVGAALGNIVIKQEPSSSLSEYSELPPFVSQGLTNGPTSSTEFNLF
ncbi:unnamed protein product, partial [Timema podura]|nr:unnamed protein product [Timema podura]